METIQWAENIPVAGEFDVVVAGGGMAGAAAALSAARGGRGVLLLEKQCSLGGLATTGLINFWVPLCNGRGRMILRGLAEELFRLSIRDGFDTLPKPWRQGEPTVPTDQRCVSWFSAGLFSLQLLRLLRDAGVTIQYDALISAPVMDGRRCAGLIVDGKSGRRCYRAAAVVDATGDADVLCRAGVPTVDGADYFTYIGEGVTLAGCRDAAETGELFRAYYRPTGGDADLHGGHHPPDMPLYVGASAEVVNEYLQRNQLRMLEKEEGRPRGERNIHMLPGMPQLRTSRRLDGDATMTAEDVYRHQPDSVGVVCDFEFRDRLYEARYGALVRTGFDNLITCGRSVSAGGWAWDVMRVIPPAVLTGQAAGTAAALALDMNCPLPALPAPALQQALADAGALIHFSDSWVPEVERPDAHDVLQGHC